MYEVLIPSFWKSCYYEHCMDLETPMHLKTICVAALQSHTHDSTIQWHILLTLQNEEWNYIKGKIGSKQSYVQHTEISGTLSEVHWADMSLKLIWLQQISPQNNSMPTALLSRWAITMFWHLLGVSIKVLTSFVQLHKYLHKKFNSENLTLLYIDQFQQLSLPLLSWSLNDTTIHMSSMIINHSSLNELRFYSQLEL